MKKKPFSRRKFLTGMGLAAGSAALLPAAKNFGGVLPKKASLLDAWTNPVPNKRFGIIQPVQLLSRKTGTHLLPLAQRPL